MVLPPLPTTITADPMKSQPMTTDERAALSDYYAELLLTGQITELQHSQFVHFFNLVTKMNTTPDLSRTVIIVLGGVSKEITITRLSESHCWFADHSVGVVCKFRTGTKYHTRWCPLVMRDGNGDYKFGPQVIHNRNARPIAWSEEKPGTSKWTINTK